MNPNKWKWYTYVVLLIMGWEAFMVYGMMSTGFYPTLTSVPWVGLAFSTSVIWLVLAGVHHVIAFLLRN